MGKENKSYRIRTNVNHDSVVNFSVDNTVETLEILSLKINQENTYRLMGSNTGIVAGRVLANGGFGVPNAKISVFIPYEDTDDIEQRVLYKYTSTTDRDYDGVRYNLLPDKVDDECHQNIGTFPSKRVLLDNDNWIDIFDKYYKFTTRTNEAGDYMIYGVPTGNQTIHMDLDMSDIGVLSQTPRDMMYNGYNTNMFESPAKFKVDTNLDSLAQVRTQDQAVYVYPFWGDTTDNDINASITRCDINVNYKFEPTCVFMGSVVTDTGENAMSKKCIGAKKQGKMADMITGEGKIEMIRKTPNGQVEQFSVNGDNNINSDGVWCYQIPMNLDYVKHDEFGKMVMTDNPNTGIPTRARVRFRLSMAESPSDAVARKRARFLIPNNPRLVEEDYPDYCDTKEIDYEFGTKTKNENFRDLFWNNVYTVKSYIPRLQKSRLPNNLRHLGIKTVNHSGGHNPMPFNNLRIKFNFMYMFLCTLVKVLVTIVRGINSILTFIGFVFYKIGELFVNIGIKINISIGSKNLLGDVSKLFASYNSHPITEIDDISPEVFLSKVWESIQSGNDTCGGVATWFMKLFLGIGCGIELKGLCETDDGEPINVSPGTYDPAKDVLKSIGLICNDRVDVLYNCIENQMAQDNEVTQFNFYNDWINGVVYLPLWYRRIRKKRNGTIKKDIWCSTDNTTVNTRSYKTKLKLYNTNIPKRNVSNGGAKAMGTINPLVNNEDTVKSKGDNETGAETIKFTKKNDENCYGYQCHKFSRTYFKVYKGLVFEKTTTRGDRVYYYKPCDYDPSTGNSDLVTLFATDLVLLGSLNECDNHGIPQFFKALESTTYNMPPDLLSEYYEYTNDDNQAGNDEQDSEEIDMGSKITEYTGADWGNLGVDQSNYNEATITILGSTYHVDANENQYDNGGLFYGLTCFDSYTKPKSCINLSRICELGISLDEMNEIPTNGGSGTDDDTDILTPDGFISYDEIYNQDYRSMFATLNSNFLKTRLNSETGLLEYDFNYLYIDNFDGSLKQLMRAKTVNGYTEKSDFSEKANYINNYNLEQSSDAYLNFRYGNYEKRNGKKIYFYENNNTVGHAGIGNVLGPTINGKNRQPRYENSFYFYFGLNEGKTAIDKFNTEFFSDCTNHFASDIPYKLTYSGNSWCPVNSNDGFIAFDMNVDGPYKITFTNRDKNNVYFQENITHSKFMFCDTTIPGNPPKGYNKYFIYKLEDKKNPTTEVSMIPNGTYNIVVVDGYGNTYKDSITFESTRIGFMCDVNPFNRKNSELMGIFGDEGEALSTTYADIANYGRFVDNNMVVDMNKLTYSLYDVNYVIKNGDLYYIFNKITGVFVPVVATSNITVTATDKYYYYHEPELDRDIRGFIALSEMTEDDFRIDLAPIDENFFGSDYIGTSITVHVTYDPYVGGATIPLGETYYLLVNGKYEPTVAQYDIVVPGDNLTTKKYAKSVVNVTENHSSSGVDVCGYLGHITYNGVTTYYFGVPYGGQKYRFTVTQLCETDGIWGDTDNVTIINVIVYEDEFKMFINGVDYDLIKNFKTGWTDGKLVNGEFKDSDDEYSTFDSENIYGWDDVLNIGHYTYPPVTGTPYELTQIGYLRNESGSELDRMLEIGKALNSEFSENGSGSDNRETPYNWYGVYCYNIPYDNTQDYYKGKINKTSYSYTITHGTLYDGDGNPVSAAQMVHGEVYYVDSTHTVEAEAGVDYTENVTYELVDVTRFDSETDYVDYEDDEYLYDGNTYRYENPFPGDTYKYGVVNGYPNGINVSVFRRTLRIKDGVTLYRNDGGNYVPVTSVSLTSGVTYYVANGSSYTQAQSIQESPTNGVYTLTSPIISYELETPLYSAEFRQGNDNPNGDVLATEDNDGILFYNDSDNIEYSDLDCLSFYDYRDVVNGINTAVSNRRELVRNVAGTFRVNDKETALVLTTKTKAKPVKYLIVGNSEISVFDKLYNYKPNTTVDKFAPISFVSMNDINDTSYSSVSTIKNVSDGYVVDKNLETSTHMFSLATLTYDYDFVQYLDTDIINNGDVYYSEDVVAYPNNIILESGTQCYYYHAPFFGRKKYYEWRTLTQNVDLSDPNNSGKYFYTNGDKIMNIAVISGIGNKIVSIFVQDAQTTSKIYKINTNGNKQYLPYYINKYKHPYYVSVMNDNKSVIPTSRDVINFLDLGNDKNLESTFGVHFYNKPLKSDFKMILSFINNIPAYPKQPIIDESYTGTTSWQPVNVFMPGFMCGYFYNGIPRSGDNVDNISNYDNTNIRAELNETEIALYTPATTDNQDTYENINVRRLIYTPEDKFTSDYPATYGEYKIEGNTNGSGYPEYQYAEVPLTDGEIVYTDGYGDNYKQAISGTLSVIYTNPILTYFNLDKSDSYVSENVEYEDYITTNTYYTNSEGYAQYQTLYYVFDCDRTEYPLCYSDNSKLKYNQEQNRFYFTEMPEIFTNIDEALPGPILQYRYISKSKSTDFNVWSYLRNKYSNEYDNICSGNEDIAPFKLTRPIDKFFVIACVNNNYSITPVIEIQRFRVILNYKDFDINSSPVYITTRDAHIERDDNTSEQDLDGNIHYIEDMYYMLYYRFNVHVSLFDYTKDEHDIPNGKYNSDVYTQIGSVSEGTAQHCYIKVHDTWDYWASAIKINLSSLGDNSTNDGKIPDWLQIIIEDYSGCMRVAAIQSGKDVIVTEFDDYESMISDYEQQPQTNP